MRQRRSRHGAWHRTELDRTKAVVHAVAFSSSVQHKSLRHLFEESRTPMVVRRPKEKLGGMEIADHCDNISLFPLQLMILY
jgi:hypothetical protein